MTPADAAPNKPADPPANSSASATKADLTATLALANIKVSRIALAEETTLADVKDNVSGIYDRQETATKDAIAKLHAASGDKAKIAAAEKALDAAGDEAVKYFKANADVKDKITKRATIINAEIGQIVRTPDAYLALVKKAGLAGESLDQAKKTVKDASKKAGGKVDGDSAEAVHEARTKVRQLLSAAQAKALDGQLGAK